MKDRKNYELRTFEISLIQNKDGEKELVEKGKVVSIDPWAAVKMFCEYFTRKNTQNHVFDAECDYSIEIELVTPAKRKKDKSAIRTCLSCEEKFKSTGPGNRRCSSCIKTGKAGYGKLSPRLQRFTNSRKNLPN